MTLIRLMPPCTHHFHRPALAHHSKLIVVAPFTFHANASPSLVDILSVSSHPPLVFLRPPAVLCPPAVRHDQHNCCSNDVKRHTDLSRHYPCPFRLVLLPAYLKSPTAFSFPPVLHVVMSSSECDGFIGSGHLVSQAELYSESGVSSCSSAHIYSSIPAQLNTHVPSCNDTDGAFFLLLCHIQAIRLQVATEVSNNC